MSFRYTNQLTSILKHRVLLERSRQALSTRTFTGHHNGVRVLYTASGAVQSITVDKAAEPLYAGEGAAAKVDTAALSLAIKAAVWDANRKLRAAKEEAYRRSFTSNAGVARNEHHAMWFEQSGAALRPLPYEALKDAPCVAAASPPSLVATVRSMPGVAASHRAMLPALLALEDARQVVAEQRQELSENELFFWRRVDLIKRAQGNVVAGPKRRYKEIEDITGAVDESTDRVQMRFTN
jgi:hypothetical protein